MKWRTLAFCLIVGLIPGRLYAQAPATPAPSDRADPDVRVDPLQPDFTLATLPTTLRMPLHKFAFRVTHRFSRALGQGDLGDLASDLFGFDSSAQIGLELRYGLAPGTQVGIHRTSDREIQLFGQHNFLKQRDGWPVGLDAIVTVEGANNLRTQYKSAIGAIVSRNLARRAALYAEPIWVANSNPSAPEGVSSYTMMLGLGTRVRIRPSAYLMAEMTPRLGGFEPGVSQISFGLEGRAGGHLFQINVSNGFGTTLGQLAGGGFNNDNWYLGFNIARKFF
ncbi:MAG: DUF5777 family beta-barrel protein [Acidobacteriota bacterium]